MTLLERMQHERLQKREEDRQRTRETLREVLRRIIPNQRVFVHGSLTKPGKFSEHSDIDLALESEPRGMTIYQLVSLLSEEMGRRVDVLLLEECRFRDKIIKEGEVWTPQD